MGAISFTKKNYTDTATSGSGITASDMNKIEKAIVDLDASATSLQNSVSTATFKTNWNYLYKDNTFGKIMYRKYNNIVFVCISVSGIDGTWKCDKYLPSGFRPPVGMYVPLAVRQSNACAMA